MLLYFCTAKGRYGGWLMVAPPLTITEEECNDLIEWLDATLREFADAAQAHMAEGN